jgi:cob(I)alamin adenosyltransferase
VIGVARRATADDAALDAILARIQNDLFDLGADLATPSAADEAQAPRLRILESQVTRLESEIDELNARLAPLTSFVLPGGSAAAAALHLARTVCRRAERGCVALAEREAVSAAALKYINRLSDLLFVAARFANDEGRGDVLWTPGATR